MTAAIQAQIAAAKGQKPSQEPRTPLPKGKTQPEPREPATSQEMPKTIYAGPYALTAANGTHYPGRMRLVLVGPASDALLRALAAALTEFVKNPMP